ncbi:MAG: alanine--tRNA ligase-related protein [Eubacteriales bacterium]|nr:alanine--tRNA ligase-related protein [Eubacteriales bacterium]
MVEKRLSAPEGGTEKLYERDSRRREFTAVVRACEKCAGEDGWWVELDRTAFFPEGGGQAGDRGWLGGAEAADTQVEDTQERDGAILHRTREPLEPGTQVKGRIDWETRFDRMQQHTGEHMVSGIVHRLWGYDNVGFHLGAEETTLDFNGELDQEQILQTELLANRAVWENLPVETLYPSRDELPALHYRSKIDIEGQVRLVRIPGVDLCACCAPHVERTGEIGLIKILSCDRHRGGCRMTIVCGSRALEDYRQRLQSVTEVSVALSAPPRRIGEAVARLQEQQAALREQRDRRTEAYLLQKLDAIDPGSVSVCLFEEELDNIAARNFVNAATQRCGGICGAFVGTDGTGYRYILGSRSVDLREFSRRLNARFAGKGGGKPEMVQGSLTGRQEEIRRMIEEG